MSHCGHNRPQTTPPSKCYLQGMLPKVGDKLIRRMDVGGAAVGLGKSRPERVTVTYVNREHLWYEVRFPSGIRQAYKLI